MALHSTNLVESQSDKPTIADRGSPCTAEVVLIIWLRGQEVKTSPFHGGNTGSIPVGVTFLNIWTHSSVG